MSGGIDIWIQGFAPGSDPVPALQSVFGIDEQRAVAIQQTVPRAVKRNAPPRDAEEIARALRSIGAKVELRPHRGDARASGAAMPRPGEARGSASGLERPPEVRASGVGLSRPEPSVASQSLPPPVASASSAPPSVLPIPLPMPSAVTEGSPARRSSRPPPSGFDTSDTVGGGPSRARLRSEGRARARLAPPTSTRERGARGRTPRPTPPPAVAAPAVAAPTVTFQLPGWIRGMGIATFLGVVFFLFRMGRCACDVSSLLNASPEELAAAAQAERDQLIAGALPLDAFLQRPNAMLGRDIDRNLALARSLQRAGARRVLVANVMRVSGGDMALTLVVELPDPPALRPTRPRRGGAVLRQRHARLAGGRRAPRPRRGVRDRGPRLIPAWRARGSGSGNQPRTLRFRERCPPLRPEQA
jgi:hypothetical protein